MSEHFADKLLAAIEEKGSPVCVGIDPRLDRLPEGLRPGETRDAGAVIEAVAGFCGQTLEVVAPYVPAVKPQIACFEGMRMDTPDSDTGSLNGLVLYQAVVMEARRLGLLVIGDVKRGDIGSTAEAYAAGHLRHENSPDAITVNGYFGADGLEPFIDACRDAGKGIFVLVRTSNPSAAAIQDFQGADGRKFYEHMAEQVAAAGAADELIGESGYSCVGAVVAATYPDEARRLREIMPQQIFLVPGYGAQGAGAGDCAAAFKPDGTGAIVNASRSVIYAFEREEYRKQDWKKAVEAAARAFAEDIRNAVAGKE